ncbi:DUF2934 domain-containing protein [Rubellimicrobium roseum]|uniref:DUF2934 domain-containing protein n=1 Tax=Rubellimicrobium roseum TaxID=687525 RepID=A0A5C4NFM1_9RHOB|nr:DUF2934 domain-containing protein [Rubellimicrobium roseum]TNC72168.1 DUF2934 domain-containing protein [Rubellimicrobium roseum]
MDQDREQRIRERAHALWQAEGQPEGRHEEHWRQAAAEIDREEAIDPDRGIAETFEGTGDAATGGTMGGASGLASGLQPGGVSPGGGPGASVGSLGTGGGSTANEPSGDVADRGR